MAAMHQLAHYCTCLMLLLQVTEYDAELRKAWFTAAAFKKR